MENEGSRGVSKAEELEEEAQLFSSLGVTGEKVLTSAALLDAKACDCKNALKFVSVHRSILGLFLPGMSILDTPRATIMPLALATRG